jgi:hypothetical protein
MKVMAIVKYVFTLVGVGMLVGVFLIYKSTSAFLGEAVKAEGTVVELMQSRSSDSTTYRPVVHFINQDGQKIEFMSTAGSNPPSYSEGQKVEVLYLTTEPQNAKINDFFSIWGGAAILGGLGGVFFLIGSGIILAGSLASRKSEYLRKNGVPIETEYQSVEQNTAFSVNGRHPFRVLTQWQNPSTSELHIFKSNNLWFDPSSYIESKKITVFIERNNPKKYFVDLSFLPELAK